jgi:hypothetical protein
VSIRQLFTLCIRYSSIFNPANYIYFNSAHNLHYSFCWALRVPSHGFRKWHFKLLIKVAIVPLKFGEQKALQSVSEWDITKSSVHFPLNPSFYAIDDHFAISQAMVALRKPAISTSSFV